jgi:endonuclease YncB( thermonuclease family)
MKKIWLWLGMAVAMVGVSMTSYQLGRKDVNKLVVSRIIDGDTLELSSKQRIRLDNMETAEVNRCGYIEAIEAGYTKGEDCFGKIYP